MEAPPPGTLFVVATPIGHLEDITLRALRVLGEVALIAAEDTRRTGNLLRHYRIQTPLISLHAHNERARVPGLLKRLRAGHSIALVSDAGTPGVSDPGQTMVRAARDAGVRVEPVPGPSAVTTVLSASGLAADRFLFAGFPPIRVKDRHRWFAWVAGCSDLPVVAYEAPHRIRRTLLDVGKYLGNRPIILARELTKHHETWTLGSATEVTREGTVERGEFTLVFAPAVPSPEHSNQPTDEQILYEFGQSTINKPASRREAIRQTAAKLGVSSKAVYTAIERHKNWVE
ncbi:MAG: 16S rRNA (cytidine(1402)-2'-O)-methyltransferase [Acidobacteriota bacterium]